jgi:hypothetical protein
MPRFFFHIETDDMTFPDVDGYELASLHAAHDYALRLIDKTMKFVGLLEGERWKVKVCDASGCSALVVLFPVHGFRWFGGAVTKEYRYGQV